MNPHIAALCCAVAVAAFFFLDRDRADKTSIALWLPAAWLFLAASRNVSEWLQLQPPANAVDRYLEGSPIDRGVLSLFMACGVIALIRRGRLVMNVLRSNKTVLVYFIYCGASILWSDYPLVTSRRWLRSLGDVIMVLVILTDPHWRAAFRRTLTRVGFLLLPISVLLIKYYPDLGRSYTVEGVPYWTGAAESKNGLGMICLVFGLACLWSFFITFRATEDRARMRRLASQGAVVSIALWLLWLVNSKTSLACFVLAGGLMILALGSAGRKPAVLLLLVIAVVAVSFSVLFLGVGGDALEAMGREGTLTGRTEIWNVVLSNSGNPLVGVGYDSFWLGNRLLVVAAALGGVTLNQAHNGYIEIYLSLGLIGLVLLAVLIAVAYRRISEGFRFDQEISAIRIAYFLMAIVYNFTEGTFKTMTPVWFVFLLAAMASLDSVRSEASPPLVVSACQRLHAGTGTISPIASTESLAYRQVATRINTQYSPQPRRARFFDQ